MIKTDEPHKNTLHAMALLLAVSAAGESRFFALSALDIKIAEALGAKVSRDDGQYRVWGAGMGCLLMPKGALDMRRDDDLAALTIGLLSTYDMQTDISSELPGDLTQGLKAKLAAFGSQIEPVGDTMLSIWGPPSATPCQLELSDNDALLIKAAALLAALNVAGQSSITFPATWPNTDEILMGRFGIHVETTERTAQHRTVSITGQQMPVAPISDVIDAGLWLDKATKASRSS